MHPFDSRFLGLHSLAASSYKQSESAKYRNVPQTFKGMVFKQTPITSRSVWDVTLKEKGCSGNISIVVKEYTVYVLRDWPIRTIVIVSEGYAQSMCTVYKKQYSREEYLEYQIHKCK